MSIIQFIGNNCKNCYKCIRNCEIKAIKCVDGQARVIEEECVLCGKCTLVCPQNAKKIFSDLENVQALLEAKRKVYVSLAPSYISAFPGVSFGQISAAIKQLGFIGVEETAIGATEVSREFASMLARKKMKNVITTCCPTVNLLVEKNYPSLIPYMAPVVAPATAHAKMLRNIYGNRVKVVFIGPCISKKHEAQRGGAIHSVLLFDELREWFAREGIRLDTPDSEAAEMHGTLSRLYPVPGGIIRTIPATSRAGYHTVAVDGLGRCISILDSLRDHDLEGYFLEMSACAGSCMEGPGMQKNSTPFIHAKTLLLGTVSKKTETPKPFTENTHPDLSARYNHTRVRQGTPTEEDLAEIFHEIGKYTDADMLNCGACGYNTCRDKAIAVYHGKADLHMCLPHLREKAESMSNLILDNTPNAIFVADKNLDILEYNKTAQRIFGLTAERTIGLPLAFIMDVPAFHELKDNNGQKVEIYTTFHDEERHLSLDMSIVSTTLGNDFIIIAKDISREEKNRTEIEKIRRETIETTQRVIDKQMRVAQEIASLLGETTGETKAALTKLKKSITAEEVSL